MRPIKKVITIKVSFNNYINDYSLNILEKELPRGGNYLLLNLFDYDDFTNLSSQKIMFYCYIKIEKTRLTFPFLDSLRNSNNYFELLNDFNKLISNKFRAEAEITLLIMMDENEYSIYSEIAKIFNPIRTENLFSLILNNSTDSLFSKVFSLKKSIIKDYLLSVLYFLKKEIYLASCHLCNVIGELPSNTQLATYLRKVNELYISLPQKNLKVLIIYDSSEDIGKPSSKYLRNYKELFEKSKCISSYFFTGIKKDILNKIEKFDWDVLILLGHGSPGAGYEVLSEDEIEESISYLDLKINQNDKCRILIDTTCSNNHFRLLAKNINKLQVLGNEAFPYNFDTTSAFFFVMGFISSVNIKNGYEFGLLSMSLYSKDRLETYKKVGFCN